MNLLVLQFALGCALFYSCFCRLTKTNADTVREIRWAILLEAVAAGLVAGAPLLPLMVPQLHGTSPLQWMPWTTPWWIWLVLLLAATLVQLATARYWRFNVPEDFQTRGFLP
jgi:hypothetical protein